MGGMGGGMMGGMGGGMGGMGGGMRSVPPTALPSAVAQRRQTRNLPTRLVSISAPDPERAWSAGEGRAAPDRRRHRRGERRCSGAEGAAAAGGRRGSRHRSRNWSCGEWPAGWTGTTIAQLSQKWANRHELTLAKDFVDHLDALPEGESGPAAVPGRRDRRGGQPWPREFSKVLEGKTVLGLVAQVAASRRRARRAGGGVPGAVERDGGVGAGGQQRRAAAKTWVAVGKFTLPVTQEQEKFDAARFADGLAEGFSTGWCGRSSSRDRRQGQGQADLPDPDRQCFAAGLQRAGGAGNGRARDEHPKVLPGISISPRRSLTLPASEEAVKTLGPEAGYQADGRST